MLVLGLGPGCEGMYLTAELQVTCPTRSGSISASAFSPPTGYGPAPCAETLTCNMHMQHAHATCTCNMHIHGPMQATQEGAPPPYCWQSRVLGCDALKAGVPAHEEARLLRRCVAFPEAALEFCRDAQGDVKIVLTVRAPSALPPPPPPLPPPPRSLRPAAARRSRTTTTTTARWARCSTRCSRSSTRATSTTP